MTAATDYAQLQIQNPAPPAQPTAMPPEIAKAVVAIMGQVRKLSRDSDNKFARYKYTSVDVFYGALGPLMAEHKLFDMAIERETSVEVREAVDDFGKVKKSAWLTATYDFWLYHESGAQFGPIERKIQVPATGAQSFAAAQSYAEKYFLRNLFKVPTGDIDEVDNAPQDGLPSGPDAYVLIDPDQAADIEARLKATASKREVFLTWVGAKSVEEMTVEQYKRAVAYLAEKQKRQGHAA